MPLMKISRLAFLCWVLAAFALNSCKSSGGITAEAAPKAPNIKTEELLDSLTAHQLACEWLSIKYDVEIKNQKVEDSFKAYVRLKSDSVIWISATYYNVEIARLLLTPDSVKYLDRRQKQYYTGTYTYLSKVFMFDADFNLIQNLLLGNSNALIDGEEKIRAAKDKGQYYLSFLRKGQLRRVKRKEEKKDEYKKELELIVSLWIRPETFRVSKTLIADYTDNRSVEATYMNHEPLCNSFFPKEMVFLATKDNEQVKVKTSVIKVSADKEVSLSFTIPEKYEALAP